MLYKFKSKVTGDLIMLEPNGRQILTLDRQRTMRTRPAQGHPAAGRTMPAAIAALTQAIEADEVALRQRIEKAKADGETLARSDVVSLRQRAVPFIEMLQRCHKADADVVWGV
jgi:hypothetical protein